MNIELHGMKESGVAYCEAEGLAECFSAYAKNCAGEWIMTAGFNPNSGYVYIALENGVTIASMLGRNVEYIRDNPENGEEVFFDSYDDALAHDWKADTDTDTIPGANANADADTDADAGTRTAEAHVARRPAG